MSVVDERRLGESRPREEYPHSVNVGPIGRLGRYTATHFRVVLVGWLLVALGWASSPRGSRPPSQALAGRRPARNRCRPGS